MSAPGYVTMDAPAASLQQDDLARLAERVRASIHVLVGVEETLTPAVRGGYTTPQDPDSSMVHVARLTVKQALRILRGDSAEVQPPPPVPEVRVAP